MFLDLFYGLREAGVPVAIQEWQTFLRALEEGLHGSSLLRFYHLGRACLIKSETYFDAYDRVFARVFKGVEGALGDDITEKVLQWLRNPKNFPNLLSSPMKSTCNNFQKNRVIIQKARNSNRCLY